MSAAILRKDSATSAPPASPVLSLQDAALSYGRRRLWSDLTLDVAPGEFLAVLGANGSGKTSLLKAILGLHPLSGGTLRVAGRPARRGSPDIGYVQQHRRLDPMTPLRARDVVGEGIDGHRWGPGWPTRGRARRARIEEALAAVGALDYADHPIGLLSGGEQQRVRIAQALVSDPTVLLCDEPLLSLDLQSQRTVTDLVDARRRTHHTGIVFVTHEINPILDVVDRVLYLAGGRFRIGTVDQVLNAQTLSDLYGTPIEVIRAHGRLVVVGMPETPLHHEDDGATAEGPRHEARVS